MQDQEMVAKSKNSAGPFPTPPSHALIQEFFTAEISNSSVIFSTSKKSADCRCPSRTALPVSMLAVTSESSSEEFAGLAASKWPEPENSLNAPRTFSLTTPVTRNTRQCDQGSQSCSLEFFSRVLSPSIWKETTLSLCPNFHAPACRLRPVSVHNAKYVRHQDCPDRVFAKQ